MMNFNRFSTAIQHISQEQTIHRPPRHRDDDSAVGNIKLSLSSTSSTQQDAFLFDGLRSRLDIQDPPVVSNEDIIDEHLLTYLSGMNRNFIDARTTYLDEEERINMMMCRELLTVGYRHIKQKMDRGDVPLGNLRYGSAWTFVRVGPMTEFVAPDDDVEMMWCWNQKAIEIIEKWPTFDDFYDVWNGVLGRDADIWDRTIVVREYNSVDYGHLDNYPVKPMTRFVNLDRNQLEKYWTKAYERVKSLKRIDELKDRIREELRRGRHRVRMREGHWDDELEDRNVRLRVM